MATCGKCHKMQQTVAHVKACYKVSTKQAPPVRLVVPVSSYALQSPHGDMEFFEVTNGTGEWSAHQFVKRLIGHPGDWAKYPVVGPKRRELLQLIAEDPKAAAMLFSTTLVVCACCHSPLSDKASRERGFGPVCIKKFAA